MRKRGINSVRAAERVKSRLDDQTMNMGYEQM